jgi:large subunit ribosomal protein L24
MYIQTGDLVQVIAGKNKGQTGRVTRVDRSRNRVVVGGLNLVTRNQKPNQISEGGRIQKEASIHASNVRLYSEADGRGWRVGARFVGQGGALFSSSDDAAKSFAEAPAKINKVRVFLKQGGEVSLVPAPVRGEA